MNKAGAANQLLAVLSHHIGQGNGIGVKELKQQLGIEDRQVRKLIEELRKGGHAVCGTPKDGYFVAQFPEELEHTCEFLYARAMCSLKQISCMKKIPLPDLRGQLHLPT